MLQTRGEEPESAGSSGSSGPGFSGYVSSGPAASAPEPVYQDLPDDDDWNEAAPTSVPASVSVPKPAPVSASPVRDSIASTPLEALSSSNNDDLQPGGGAGQGLEKDELQNAGSNEQFRELFSSAPPSPPAVRAVAAASDMSLDSMPVRELRRLAEQRGITGVSDLKKKELLAALRQQITSVPVATGATGAKEVVVERTLDLTEPETVDLTDVPVLD